MEGVCVCVCAGLISQLLGLFLSDLAGPPAKAFPHHWGPSHAILILPTAAIVRSVSPCRVIDLESRSFVAGIFHPLEDGVWGPFHH